MARSLLQALSVFANFCARVSGFAFDDPVPVAVGGLFPALLNVALEGAPNTVGWGVGVALHVSTVVHGGLASAGWARHGEEAGHSRAT